jgi:cytochrome c oxidase subunit 1
MSWSALMLGAAQIPFILNFLLSLKWGKKAEANHWHANTLEWADTTSPPPYHNYDVVPTVLRGPYEYGSPETTEDYLPQSLVLPAKA